MSIDNPVNEKQQNNDKIIDAFITDSRVKLGVYGVLSGLVLWSLGMLWSNANLLSRLEKMPEKMEDTTQRLGKLETNMGNLTTSVDDLSKESKNLFKEVASIKAGSEVAIQKQSDSIKQEFLELSKKQSSVDAALKTVALKYQEQNKSIADISRVLETIEIRLKALQGNNSNEDGLLQIVESLTEQNIVKSQAGMQSFKIPLPPNFKEGKYQIVSAKLLGTDAYGAYTVTTTVQDYGLIVEITSEAKIEGAKIEVVFRR
jgi:hypothetical protein